MRAANQVMAQLAASGLTTEQLALVMELSAAVATEARPNVDEAAERRRAKDREYQASKRRQNRPTSADEADAETPPKSIYQTPSSVPDGTGGKPPSDPVKGLIDEAVALLVSQGQTEKGARSIIGKWRKGGERDGEIIAALVEARQRSISNLVEWMPKRLNGSRSTDPPSFLDHYREEQRRKQQASGIRA